MGVLQLPAKYSEQEVADYLEVSVSFLQKERAAGNISFTRKGRTPVYLDKHIIEYLERNEQKCQNDSKSENTGSPKDPAAPTTTQRGLTRGTGRQSAHLSAVAILKPQRKS